MITRINQAGTVPHFEVSDDSTNRISIQELLNKSGAKIITYNNGNIIDNLFFKGNDIIVVIAPAGNWQWEVSDDGNKYRKLFVMPSIAPDLFRINIVLNGLKAPATWNRWTKV